MLKKPKKPITETPNYRITNALRMLFLRSPERATRLKMDKYTCQRCGVKQSMAKGKEVKVQVHHRNGIRNWTALRDSIRAFLLCKPEEMETLCKECHKKEEVK